VARQLLLDVVQKEPGVLVVLHCSSGREVSRKLVEMNEDGSSNLFVSGASRPKVRRYATGDADHIPESRGTEFFVLFHQKARPAPEVLK